MQIQIVKKAGAFVGVVLTMMLALSAPVRGELVYDEPATAVDPAITDRTPDDRNAIRDVLQAAEAAQINAQRDSFGQPEVEHPSKAELIRRRRMREELRNEDMLQVRLEEIRLRDEMRRTKELLEGQVATGATGATGPTGAAMAAPVEQEVISPELAAQQSPFPAQQPVVQDRVMVAQAAPVQAAPMAVAGTSEAVFDSSAQEEKTRIAIQPRGGMADFMNDTANQINGRFGIGIGAGVEVSDNLTFELGYTYAEYGVTMQSYNYTVSAWQWAEGNPEPVVLKQNIIDAGLKMSLLDRSSKLRPFLGGGAAYSKGFVNYEERYQQVLNQSGQSYQARDYELSSFLGYLSTGFDLTLTKSVSVGATFKYYAVLTSRENQSFNAYQAQYWGPYSMDAEKQAVGSSLSRANFYSILAGVNFVF